MQDPERPLDLGALVTDVGDVLRERGLPFVLAAAAVTAPAALATELWQTTGWEAFGLAFVPAQVVDFVGRQLVTAALIHATAKHLAGKESTFKTNIASGWKSLGRAIWTGVISMGLVFLGFLALIVPGLVLAVRYFVAVPAAVVEGRSGGPALARSRDITAGHGWSLFGLMMLMGVATLGLAALFGVAGVAVGPLVGGLSTWALNAVWCVVMAVGTTVVYWRLRAAHDLREAVQARFG